MTSRQFDRATSARAERCSVAKTDAPKAKITHGAYHGPLIRSGPGAGGIAHPRTQAAVLVQASGGRLGRARSSLLHLQRQYGNRYVQQVAEHARQMQPPHSAPVIQTKLAVGMAGDRYERAADRMARGAAEALPRPLRQGLEELSGLDLSDIRVVHGSTRPESLGARACASNGEIHLASGEEQHLPHEAWHVVQQRQGRVARTTHVGETPVNADRSLEREADTMGAKAAASTSTPSAAPRSKGMRGTSPTQLKSTMVTTPREKGAETPLATLSRHFEPYFTAAGVAEQYNFYGLGLLDGTQYAGSWDRAGKVVAEIDPASKSKADSKNRNNQVIGPYGHFGVMERSIFDRPPLGNTYDGGHLVEHTLMEGQDADKHGNLAPQENKNFNQGLMRGWEAVPENLMHSGHRFTYTVEVEYSDDKYNRTGAQLLKAGVLTTALPTALPPSGPYSKATLDTENVTFRRWVPYYWGAETAAPGSTTFPLITLTKGAHFHNLNPDKATAKGIVLNPASATYTVPGISGLKRQNSGTLAGALEGATVTSTGSIFLSAGQTHFRAHMYQPEPQDQLDQPAATTTPAGGVPALLPVSTLPTAILPFTLSAAALTKQLSKVPKSKNLDQKATKESKLYASLRAPLSPITKGKKGKPGLLTNKKYGDIFVQAIHQALETKGADTLTKAELIKAIRHSKLTKAVKQPLLLMDLDPNFQA